MREETVLAKKTFERYASLKGVRIQHYHADNGNFADKTFVNQLSLTMQLIVGSPLVPFLMCALEIPQNIQHKFFAVNFCYLYL